MKGTMMKKSEVVELMIGKYPNWVFSEWDRSVYKDEDTDHYFEEWFAKIETELGDTGVLFLLSHYPEGVQIVWD